MTSSKQRMVNVEDSVEKMEDSLVIIKDLENKFTKNLKDILDRVEKLERNHEHLMKHLHIGRMEE